MLKEVSRTTPYCDCARSAQRDVLSVLRLKRARRLEQDGDYGDYTIEDADDGDA